MSGVGRIVVWVVLCGLLMGPAGCTRVKPPRVREPFKGVPTVAAPATALPKPTLLAPTTTPANHPSATPASQMPTIPPPVVSAPGTQTPAPMPPAASDGPTPTVQAVTYIVQPGDNLMQIAAQHQTTVRDILFWNPSVPNQDSIQAGTRLIIPSGATDTKHTHRVQYGESLTDIAYRYGVSVEAVLQANSLPNPNLLQAGQELVIPE